MPKLPSDVRGLVTKLLLAAVARLPWKPKRLYLPLLRQTVRDPHSTVSTYNEIFVHEIYRPIRPLPAGARVIDVGAHYGMFAIYAMRKLGASRVDSFEPNPYTFEVLQENISTADPKQACIAIHPVAVTLDGKPAQILVKDNNKTSVDSSVVHRPANLDEPYHLVDVKVLPIAQALQNGCDLLKFDAEGIEYDVLQHETVTPARVREIVTEIHYIDQQPQRFRDLVNTLLARGYTAYDEGRTKLSPQDIDAIARVRSALTMHFA